MKPLLGIVLVFCLTLGAVGVQALAEPGKQSAATWAFLAGAHLALLAWAGVTVWWTRTHLTWMNTGRKAWLIAMALAYLVGIAGGVYVFVFN